jgi:gamma-glutamyltranspeptidase/glutathione hydrolase
MKMSRYSIIILRLLSISAPSLALEGEGICQKLLVALLVGVILIARGANAQGHGIERAQARSVVISTNGIVAAESPLAAAAGTEILRSGGNAIDAAVAANAAMGVVAPMANGMGGDLFAIIYDAKEKKLYGLNASGYAPAKASSDLLRAKGYIEMPQRGIYSVDVPGVVDGWQKMMDRFGRKKMSDVLAPAIHIAEQGFPVTEWVADLWYVNAPLLREEKESSVVFLINDQPPAVGQVFRNSDVAETLKKIAHGGRDAFYRGDIARRIVEASRQHSGLIELDDLASYSSEWVEPMSTNYRGWRVYELPPNGQGIAALEMLNLMENFPLQISSPGVVPGSEQQHAQEWAIDETNPLHVMIEAKKLAYADVQKYIGDPAHNPAVMEAAKEMLDKKYAKQRATLIDMHKANCNVDAGPALPPGGDTTFLSVVDREGNMVSLIQSNYESFGSGVVPHGAGFALQNRGGLFSLVKGSPNELAGHKRPLHTIIPAFMQKDDVRIAFGIQGGWNQAQAHAQFVSDIVDTHQNIQMAMEAARFSKATFEGCDVEIENRIPEHVLAELEARGHAVTIRHGYSYHFGGGQAVMRDFKTGVNFGASDPRKDGAAIPEMPY